MRRLIATGILILLAGVAGCGTAGSAASPQATAPVAAALRGFHPATPGVLTVATNLPGPGFWDGNSPAALTGGFEYGMAQYMARALRLRLKVINVGWDGLVAGEVKGFDLALSTINITAARQKVALFSIPYFASNQGVLVRAGTKVTAASARTLRWGVEQSSTSYAYLTGADGGHRRCRCTGCGHPCAGPGRRGHGQHPARAATSQISAGTGSAPRARRPGRPGGFPRAPGHAAPPAVFRVKQHPYRHTCPQTVRPGHVACLALMRTDVTGHKGLFRRGVTAQAAPSGYGPSDLQSAYDLPSATAGSGATVAVVDAYDDPNAESDLATYRAQYGLPPCTTANGCFEKVNQEGQQGNYPPASPSGDDWTTEESLDIDMISAICPNCHILLVEADNDTDITNLGAAEDEAVALGAQYISNSWGASPEPSGETSYDQYFNHPGVAITASAGDDGYGVNYPSASQYVTAVGGTTLVQDSSTTRGWAETVWDHSGNGTGSGCSAFEPQPSWQAGITADCANRATADISADADPSTGVAVYDTANGNSGWEVFGGTSVASPIIASTYALAGTPASGTYPASYLYAHYLASPSVFNDVTTGSNGDCGNALCNAGPGWDGPTGLGTPDGVSGFTSVQSGSVTGTVTDAATGQPIAGATVSIPRLSMTTGSDGRYTLSGLPAGSYQVTVSGYGYQNATATVTVTAGQVTTQDIQLTGSPHETVSGTVTAATGTAWPLYAQVSWSDGNGHSGTVYTTPATGRYSLSLLGDGSYTLTVTPLYPGYQPTTQAVTVATGNVTQNVSLGVDTLACDAVGYHQVLSHGTMDTFNSALARRGWTVTNTNLHYPSYARKPGWVFDDPGLRGNQTGGSGGFATVDSAHEGPQHYQDTHLISPAASVGKNPALVFGTDLVGATNSTATVDLSVNGGKTWTSIWRNSGQAGDPGPVTVVLPVPQAAGEDNVRVRFGYTCEDSGYWEIDNVFLGTRTCAKRAGALLTGRVTDSSGNAVNGATVASVADPAETATTVATPGDDSINGGLYDLFATGTGSQQFTASATGYTSSAQSARLAAGQVSTLNFTMAAAGQARAVQKRR